jgi:hypothetical protein
VSLSGEVTARSESCDEKKWRCTCNIKGISSGPTHCVRARPIWSDRTGAPVAHAPAVRRIRTDASVHQIWVTDASMRIGTLSAHVLPRGSRPRMAATQRARAMLVKGWARRLAFCCAAPSFCSTPWHWQLAAPPDAWRGHFNAGAWTFAPACNADAWTSALASNAIRSF